MLIPEVVGFRLTGSLGEGITATDLVLTVTQMLRAKGVVGRFVEFYGPGLDALSLADRATIANMRIFEQRNALHAGTSLRVEQRHLAGIQAYASPVSGIELPKLHEHDAARL